jgi:hypothetical protein
MQGCFLCLHTTNQYRQSCVYFCLSCGPSIFAMYCVRLANIYQVFMIAKYIVKFFSVLSIHWFWVAYNLCNDGLF